MSPESLAIKLRQARGAMSLAEAAEMSQIPEERIRMYEEGVRRPYGKTLRRLADVYGMRVADLLGAGGTARTRAHGGVVRRRRRRVAVGEAGDVISVPLEVGEGQTVRLVIELVVRHRQDEEEASGEGAGESGGTAERPEAPGARPESLAASAEAGEELQAPARRRVSLGGPGRRPGAGRRMALPEEPRQARDPILDLRRAYRDFRQKKP